MRGGKSGRVPLPKDYIATISHRASGLLPLAEKDKFGARLLRAIYRGGDTVLEAGCGAGDLLRALREHVDRGVAYSGFDPDAAAIRAARRVFRGVDFRIGSIEDLVQGRDSVADITICSNVLQHLPRALSAIRVLATVTRRVMVMRLLVSDMLHEIRLHERPGQRGGVWLFRIEERSTLEQILHEHGFARIRFVPERTKLTLRRRPGAFTYTWHGAQMMGEFRLPWVWVMAER